MDNMLGKTLQNTQAEDIQLNEKQLEQIVGGAKRISLFVGKGYTSLKNQSRQRTADIEDDMVGFYQIIDVGGLP